MSWVSGAYNSSSKVVHLHNSLLALRPLFASYIIFTFSTFYPLNPHLTLSKCVFHLFQFYSLQLVLLPPKFRILLLKTPIKSLTATRNFQVGTLNAEMKIIGDVWIFVWLGVFLGYLNSRILRFEIRCIVPEHALLFLVILHN